MYVFLVNLVSVLIDLVRGIYYSSLHVIDV